MKFTYFIAFFFLFGVVGGVRGCLARDTRAQRQLIQDLSIFQKDGVPYLAHRCNGKVDAIYNTETRTVTTDSAQVAASRYLDAASAFQLDEHKDLIIGIIGGGSASWSLKEISKAMKEEKGAKLGKLVAAVLGAICGYGFGWWVTEPDCDSASVRKKLTEPAEWESVTKAAFMIRYTHLSQMTERLSAAVYKYANDPFRLPQGDKERLADGFDTPAEADLKARTVLYLLGEGPLPTDLAPTESTRVVGLGNRMLQVRNLAVVINVRPVTATDMAALAQTEKELPRVFRSAWW